MSRDSIAKTWFAGRRSFAPLCVLALSLPLFIATFPLDAKADSFTVTGPTSFNVGYSILTPLNNLLTGTGAFTVTSFSSTEVNLGVQISNTTSNYVVSSIGFNTNPAVTASFTSAGSVFTGIANDTNFPNVSNPIQVCAFTSSNCSSSANPLALQPGTNDTFALKLTGAFSPSLTLSTFAIKFAGGPEGSFEGQGKVPVPGTLLLFGVGFVLFATWHNRSRRFINVLS